LLDFEITFEYSFIHSLNLKYFQIQTPHSLTPKWIQELQLTIYTMIWK
jgi:hypothetical protein